MKLLLKNQSGEKAWDVDLTRVSPSQPGSYTFASGEQQSQVDIKPAGADRGLIRLHGRVSPFYTVRNKHHVDVWVHGKVFRIEQAQAATGRAAGGAVVHSNVLIAPMPGTVLRIEVETGQSFGPHDPLIIIESMKMETTLSVPHAGRVKSITCKEGDLVAMGAMLVQLEDDQDNG